MSAIECVHGLTKSCRKMVASPFRIFVDAVPDRPRGGRSGRGV